MKKYNYENLKEDEHVVPSLGILPIKISEDYNYISKNIIYFEDSFDFSIP